MRFITLFLFLIIFSFTGNSETLSFYQEFSSFKEAVEKNNLSDTKYMYGIKKTTVTFDLPDKQKIKIPTNGYRVGTYGGLLVSAGFQLPDITKESHLNRFLAKNSFLQKQWKEESKEWLAKKEPNYFNASLKFEGYAVNIDVSLNDKKVWKVNLDVKIDSDEAKAKIIEFARKNGTVAPHKTLEFPNSDMFRTAVVFKENTLMTFDRRSAFKFELDTGKVLGKTSDIYGHSCYFINNMVYLSTDKKLTIYDAENEISLKVINGQIFPSKDGKMGVLKEDQGYSVISIPGGKKISDIPGIKNYQYLLDTNKSSVLASTNSLETFDLKSGKKLATLENSRNYRAASFFNNDIDIISCGPNMNVWDAKTGKLKSQTKTFRASKIKLSHNEKYIVTSQWSHTYVQNVFLYDITGKLLKILGPLKESPYDLVFSKDDKKLIVPMAHSNEIHIWDLNEVLDK